MMSGVFRLKDRHGNVLEFAHCGEYWCAAVREIDDYREHLNKTRQLELIDGDVILASFPRSGTYWHHQILLMLMNDTTDYLGHMDRDHLEWCPFEKLARPETPRLYVTHCPRFRLLPQQVKEKKAKVIYTYRNPKDNWVSWYYLARSIKLCLPYEGTWSHFFDLMMECGYCDGSVHPGRCTSTTLRFPGDIGGLAGIEEEDFDEFVERLDETYGDWFDHVLDYENAAREHPDLVFFSCYELMKKDPVGQIMKINQFLGLNRSRQLCEQIAEACQFSTMKVAREAKEPQIHGDDNWKEGAPRIYRKGEIGDWKNWFTVAQSEQLDAVFKKRMSGSQLPFFFQ